MINKLGLLLLAVGMHYAVLAQTITPKIGLALATMDLEESSNNPDYKLVPGISGGVSIGFSLGEKLSLQPEFLFVQKGYESSYVDSFEGDGISSKYVHTTKVTVNYLEVPILVKLTFGKSHVNLGPSIGYGLGGKSKYSYTGTVTGQSGTSKYSESYKGDVKFEKRPSGYEGNDMFADNRIDFGVQIGGGITLINRILIDVRYGIGFTDLVDNDKSKNRVLQITVGMPIKL